MSLLAVLLAVLVWIVLLALGLALAVVLLPFELRVRGAVRDGELSGAVLGGWAFGLVAVGASLDGIRVRVAGLPVWRAAWRDLRRRGEARRHDEPERRRARRRKREGRQGRSEPLEAGGRLRALREHRRTLLGLLARFARALHLRLRARGTIGLDDPADTALLASVLDGLRRVPGVELELEVDWLDETLEGEAVGSARVWVPELLAVAVAFWMRRSNRAAVRALAQ